MDLGEQTLRYGTMHSFSTLHELVDPAPRAVDPALETLTIQADIRDLGVQESHCTPWHTSKAHRDAQCRVVVLSGPEIRNLRTGEVHKAGWIL